jgi:hypothetical protein
LDSKSFQLLKKLPFPFHLLFQEDTFMQVSPPMPTISLISVGFCVKCKQRPASSVYLHATTPGNSGVAHFSHCAQCYHQIEVTPECWCGAPASHLLRPGSLQNTRSAPTSPHHSGDDGCVFVGKFIFQNCSCFCLSLLPSLLS